MTPKTDHPFQPGVEVAIRATSNFSFSTWTRAKVGAVYKTGNFILAGDSKQQWRPSNEGGWSTPSKACAYEAARNYSRKTLYLLSDVKEDIEKDRAEQKRYIRLTKIRDRINRTRYSDFTESMLDAIEAALPPIEEPKDG